MQLRTLHESGIRKGARVIVRADFDVGDKNGRIQDDFRIHETIPTLRFILKQGGLVRIIAHRDRPGGKIVSALSLRGVAPYLESILKRKIIFIADPLTENFYIRYNQSPAVLLMENIRFWPGEETNDQTFAKNLARWGDIYINEAFADCHRAHASMAALPKLLPSFAGLRLEKEISFLERIIVKPKRPFIAILGGAKLETKLPLVKKFLAIADQILIGGAAANALFFLAGRSVGKSRVSVDGYHGIFSTPQARKKIFLPADIVVTKSLSSLRGVAVKNIDEIERNDILADIGPRTVETFVSFLKKAKTIVWNGPLGIAEISRFSKGTREVASALRDIGAFKVVGGGDTLAALNKYKLLNGFSHVSTGGGAMLEFLAGNKLPGIEVLRS